MPFEVRQVTFFVCPKCKMGYPVPERPEPNTILRCRNESCNGQEIFYGAASPVAAGGEGPIRVTQVKQPMVITLTSAILINIVLIVTLVILFYVIPIVLHKWS